MQIVVARLMLCALAACGHPTHYYAIQSAPPPAALGAAETRLAPHASQITRSDDGRTLHIALPQLPALFRTRTVAVLRGLERDGGTLLELSWPTELHRSDPVVAAALDVSDDDVACLRRESARSRGLLASIAGNHARTPVSCGAATKLWPAQRVGQFASWQLEVASFLTLGRDADATVARTSIVARVGHEWMHGSRNVVGRSARWATSLHAEVGGGFAHRFTCEVGPCGYETGRFGGVLRFTRRPTVAIVAGHDVPTGNGIDLDLGVAGIQRYGELAERGWNGLELSAAIRVPDLGGVRVHGSADLRSWGVGVELASPATAAILGALLVWCGAAAVVDEWNVTDLWR